MTPAAPWSDLELAMLIDWTTNLWQDEHMQSAGFPGMNDTQHRPDAGPLRHREAVASADRFLVCALRFPLLGLNVPNEYIADYVAASDGRGIGLACVNPRDAGSAAELRHCVTSLQLKGLKLAPTFQNFDPWCDDAFAIYALADELRVPIYWHQSSASHPQSIMEYADPARLDRICRTFPRLVMVVEHFGMPWDAVVLELMQKHANFYTDVSARVRRTWTMAHTLRRAMDCGVTGKVLFGSDFPVQSTQDAVAAMWALTQPEEGRPTIPEAVVHDILYERPLEMLWPEGLEACGASASP